MLTVLNSSGRSTAELYNLAASGESNRALITVINVFSYGFIILISLIAVANVFNTISTNIALRRREFAMLRSVGMTQRGFGRMMNYECLLYGFKGLLYGLPASFGVTWLIYQAARSGFDTDYYVPWISVVIAVGSVFLVVFTTIVYSMGKIKKDNPIDALKNENL
jgi:putative ABC transport system permease protein